MAGFLVELALYVAALGGAGHALAAWTILPSTDEARRPLRAAVVLAIAAVGVAALRFVLNTAELAGGWSSILDPPYLAWTWKVQWLFLVLLAAGAATISIGAAIGQRPLAAVGAVVLLASFATIGHVSAGKAPAWLRLALGAHLLGVSFWTAAPALLWPRGAIGDAALLARVKAFSRIAAGLVPVALIAGATMAVVLVGSVAHLTGSGYGRMILVKSLAASVAFLLGALNKTWVTTRLAVDPPRGRALLRLTLGADALLFTAALTAIAAATTIFPPAA
jgi:putative copper export protein